MDMRDLAYFEVIAETQNLGQASERLGRTKPALTKSIRRLEESLGAALFVRVGRGIVLTPVGRILRDRSRRIATTMEEVLREVSEFASGTAGHVRIGAGATTVEYLLPAVFNRLTKTNPEITAELVIGMNDVLRASLREGKLDLVVGPVMQNESGEFVTEVLVEDEVVVAANSDHPLCAATNASIEDLVASRWVLPATSVATRQWLDRAFTSRGLPGPKVHIETNSLHLLPQLIAQTDLLSFIPRRNLRPERARARLTEIYAEATTMRRHFGIVYRRDSYLSPATVTLIAELQKSAEALLAP
ncbi:LysR family transcriptional regulator [Ensifer adhaerens]|uniref:LysR family transcriptional regulator n=1 Tax=Ensifer adhaerens TaxID=106592 RepID=UPI0023A9CE7B|nr:LysR family transcriptional regulator [Ensifer adhaerens]WDZ76241.1 LysR family transcriptional regulator [Ensifer adhaerens]